MIFLYGVVLQSERKNYLFMPVYAATDEGTVVELAGASHAPPSELFEEGARAANG